MSDVWVVERCDIGGYPAYGTYINTLDHEVVAVYDNKNAAEEHARRLKSSSVTRFALRTEA